MPHPFQRPGDDVPSSPAGITRRQEAARYLRVNGNFYCWRSDFVRRLERSEALLADGERLDRVALAADPALQRRGGRDRRAPGHHVTAP